MFKKILLAIDGSRDATEASRYVQELALRYDAQVFVVHVIPSTPSYLGDPWQQEAISHNILEGEKVTEPVAKQLKEAGVDVIVEMVEGSPADGILRVADVREPDLIVMGSRGHSDLTSLLLGSVSHRVLAHARVPVMITKAPEEEIE
jgi:nucleotide-binding universal stress UspA family protein